MHLSARERRGQVGWMDDLWGPFQPQVSTGLSHLEKDGSVQKGRGKAGESGIRQGEVFAVLDTMSDNLSLEWEEKAAYVE